MSITRDHGQIVFQCDTKRCHETLETEQRDFDEAKKMAYEEGWILRKNAFTDNEWANFHSEQCYAEHQINNMAKLNGPPKPR